MIPIVTWSRSGLAVLLVLAGCSTRPVGQDEGNDGGSSEPGTSTAVPDGTGPGPTSTLPTATAPTTLSTTGMSATGTGPLDDDDTAACFLCPPDTGPLPRSCDVVEQDCPAGSKCVWYAPPFSGLRRDAARCIPVTGDGAPFDPCTLPTGIGPEITDDCGPESFCLEVYGTADHGFCAPFYDSDSCNTYPGADGAFENGSDFPAACLHYECTPLLPDGCPDGMRCTFYPAYLYGSMMCWNVPPKTDLPLGTPCDFGQCGEGKLCAPSEWLPACAGERCCAEWCDLNAPACATAGTSCEFFPVWNYQGDPGFENLGACVLPGSFD